MKNKLYAAVDLGGTKIYTVVAAKDGAILSRVRRETPAGQGPEAVIKHIDASVRDALQQAGAETAQLAGAGVCVAGFFDWQERLLIHSPNIPGWHRVPVEDRLSSVLQVPVLVENDANAAALGEVRRGAGQGSHDAVFITVSTGIGAGLVHNGQIYRGARGFAGEAGHMVVKPDGPQCGCGRHGCLETVASGTAIARTANQALAARKPSLLQELVKEKGRAVVAADVFLAAAEGDALSRAILQEAIHYLGIGLVNLVNLLNPAVIIIGGGVSEAGEALLVPLENIIRENAIPPAAASVTLKKAALGVEAGVTGMLCRLADEESRRG